MSKANAFRRAKSRPFGEHAVMRRVFELVREPVFVVDALRGHIVDVNPAACGAAAIDRDLLIGRPWSRLAARLGEATVCDIDRRYFIAIVHASCQIRSTTSSFPPDALTGLATRESLHASDSLDHGQKLPAWTALFFIDLDGFKRVNDTCGHLAGDHVLQVVARRLSKSVRSRDLVVRYGGDEFIVAVDAMSRRRDLDRLAGRITRTLRRAILVNGHTVVLSASIGITMREGIEATIDDLIAQADRAMYRAKPQNRTDGTSITPPGWIPTSEGEPTRAVRSSDGTSADAPKRRCHYHSS